MHPLDTKDHPDTAPRERRDPCAGHTFVLATKVEEIRADNVVRRIEPDDRP